MVLSPGHEGTNFVEEPLDSGGASRYGVSLKFYRSKIQSDATSDTIRNLTVNEAADIYHKYFWMRAPFAEITSQTLCNRLFDLSVNIGLQAAISCLQKAIVDLDGPVITIDGMLGPKTLTIVNSANETELYAKLLAIAAVYYNEIVKVRPQDERFLNGWLNRLNSGAV